MYVAIRDFISFLESDPAGGVFPSPRIHLPVRRSSESLASFWARFSDRIPFSLDGYRTVDPLKVLFYNVREQIVPFERDAGSRLILGARACDLKALEVLDKALLNEEFADPSYRAWREATTIVASDCTDAAASCHCTLAGGKPYAESGYDVNASRLGDAVDLRAGSGKGERFLGLIEKCIPVRRSGADELASIERNRAEMVRRVEAQNAEFRRPDETGRLRESPVGFWKEESAECVGCGACTQICPTCTCLILDDESKGGPFVKVRSYDSCQWHGYARVASGASPRPLMHERFRNRYLCKFVFMKSHFERLGCTGCGRCTEACPSKIEFRAVVRRGCEPDAPRRQTR